MTLPGKNWDGTVPLKHVYSRVSSFIKKNNIEEDGIIHQQELDFWLPDGSTILKTLGGTEKIWHNAAKCEKKRMNGWLENTKKVQKQCICNEWNGFSLAR